MTFKERLARLVELIEVRTQAPCVVTWIYDRSKPEMSVWTITAGGMTRESEDGTTALADLVTELERDA